MVFCSLEMECMHEDCHRAWERWQFYCWTCWIHLQKCVTFRELLWNGNAFQFHIAFSHLVCHSQETIHQKRWKPMHLKASAKQKTEIHWKQFLSREELRTSWVCFGVMPLRLRQEFPQRSATFWKRLKPAWCWHSTQSLSHRGFCFLECDKTVKKE